MANHPVPIKERYGETQRCVTTITPGTDKHIRYTTRQSSAVNESHSRPLRGLGRV